MNAQSLGFPRKLLDRLHRAATSPNPAPEKGETRVRLGYNRTYRVPADARRLRVGAGVAWLTLPLQDCLLWPGDEMTLDLGRGTLAVVTPLNRETVELVVVS